MCKKQKIIVKKVLSKPDTSAEIHEGIAGEPGIIAIPDGWDVKQLLSTPLQKDGTTRYIVYTMLLESKGDIV